MSSKKVFDYIKQKSGYNTVNSLINGREGFSPKVKTLLEKFGQTRCCGLWLVDAQVRCFLDPVSYCRIFPKFPMPLRGCPQ